MSYFLSARDIYILMLFSTCVYPNALNTHCPNYCLCYTWESMKAANCVNQNIITVDVGVPYQTEALDVSNNYVTRIEDNVFEIQGTTALKYLNLSDNHIKYIEMNGFSGLKKLQVLDLSNNHLHYLFGRTFDVLENLRALYLSGNKFNKWTTELHLKSLRVLDLSDCNIESVAVNAFNSLTDLEFLSMENNQLTVLKTDVFLLLHNLQIINISRNPLKCDEEINQLQIWLLIKKIKHTPICINDEKKNKLQNKDKFERIVSVVDNSSGRILKDLRNYWTIEDSENTLDLNKTHDSRNCTTEKNGYFFNIQFFEKIPSFWAFLIGFQSGIVISIIAVLMSKIKCCRLRLLQNNLTSQHRLSQTSALEHLRGESSCLWDVSGMETPPPPYRDVVHDSSNYRTR